MDRKSEAGQDGIVLRFVTSLLVNAVLSYRQLRLARLTL